VTLGGSGAVDGEAGLVEMELDFGALFEALGSAQEGVGNLGGALALFGDEPISFVIDGTTLYLRWPLFAELFGASTDWVAFEEIEATDSTELPGLEGFVAPGRYLGTFDALFDLRETGSDSWDGVETTRYDGIFDLLTAAETSAGEGLDPFSTANAFLDIPGGLSELPISVWVDADERVRRFSLGFSDEIDDVPVRFELVYELFGFGEAIRAAVPDPSEVTIVDGSSLFGAFGDIELTS